ncbi:sulfite exporter TauE/SafE family protein [Palleronia sp. KMU-117]|uniref:sulfite exporter TauE/SafE family protein n=1 Tax=Palleronia sp. KMU-117 TaxID=3434108 RepID=UPI003D71DB46
MTGTVLDYDPLTFAVIFAALALGGTMKGATGAGAPVIAIPVMAAFYDVRFAVVMMAIPGVVMNIMQLRKYHAAHLPDRFALKYAICGGTGTFLGTIILATLPVEALTLIIAGAVVAYILLRIARPGFKIPWEAARRLVWPVGLVSGVLQGSAGLSAPVSVSFLNALRIPREAFIVTISSLFTGMSLVQVPALIGFGLLTWDRALLSLAALIPLLGFMPVGNWLARRLPPVAFDRLVLVLLTILAVRLIWSALA